MEAALTYENFAKQLSTEFQVDQEGEQVQLVLIEMSQLKKTERQEEFSLMFRGPLERPLSQATHQFKHPEMGDFPLFIVPIKRNEDGFNYEAVFNRFLES
ncbi:MAG TPA: hypothetical protein VJV03_12945 [Pyrinomonadaceae bacterium]|nr:hypothetical protein [Pyrinomonadaceae bacterium]